MTFSTHISSRFIALNSSILAADMISNEYERHKQNKCSYNDYAKWSRPKGFTNVCARVGLFQAADKMRT